MIDEKDKQIERLFDDYASSLQPNTRLAGRAAEQMRAKKEPKSKAGIIWGSLAAALYTVIAAVFAVTGFIDRRNSDGGGIVPDVSEQVIHYSINEIKASRADFDFAADYLNPDLPTDAQIFSENYYACYIKDSGEFVYLKAVLGISYNDGNIQMTVVAEKSGYENRELAAKYEYLMRGTGYRYEIDYLKGEYVTVAYKKTNKYNYYVSAMGNVDGAQDIAEILVNID